MKGHDVGLLLKLLSLHKQEQDSEFEKSGNLSTKATSKEDLSTQYTARVLENETGISTSQINLALNRCLDIGLAKKDRRSGLPRAHTKALYNFIVHGIKYVFPVKPSEITRGIAAAFAAPVLNDKLMSAGELVFIWPDAKGSIKGQAVEPLFKLAVYASQRDFEMYALLALVDAIRIGQPRESQLGIRVAEKRLGLK